MSKGERDKKWKEAWRFSARERRALLYLLPVLAVASWLVWEIARPHFDDTFTEYADLVNTPRTATVITNALAQTADSLFLFDPNTIEYHDLCRLGFTRNEALGIVKYRERGKVFEIPEDFASCYQVSEEMYDRLRPYIDIGDEHRLVPHEKRMTQMQQPIVRNSNPAPKTKSEWNPEPFSLDTISVAGLQRLGFSLRQAEVILNYRNMKGKLRSAEEFAECYVVSDEMFARLSPYIAFPEEATEQTVHGLINLNTADSTTLRSVSGIGEKTVVSIMDYRLRLGGFHHVEQLAEVPGVTEQNWERISKQIFVDSCDILKIDINFATAKDLGRHPYIQDKTLRKLLKLRQLKGGWSNTGQLIEDKIFTPGEAEKIAPYLLFGQLQQ